MGVTFMKRSIVLIVSLVMVISALGGFFVQKSEAASSIIVEITQTPWIIEDQGRLKSETKLTIENTGEPYEAWVEIRVTGNRPYMQSIGMLETGTNEKIVNVLELNRDGDQVAFRLYNNAKGIGRWIASQTVKQNKIRHWKVYVAHDMHLDIGYTNLQEDLNHSILPGYIDDALQYIEETKSWQANDRFKYPMESSYMLQDSALIARDADWEENFKNSLSLGDMTYPSSYVNIVYGGMGTEELARINYYSERYLHDRLGVASNKVLHMTDSPGFTWAAIDAMVESGIKYAMLRQNPVPLEAYPKLFYFEGRTPDNRLLTFNYGHYGTDEFELRNSDSQVTFQKATETIMDYQIDASYPYDAIIANFTTPYDNKPTTTAVKANIKALNASQDSQGRDYVYPQFITSTVDDFFEYVDSKFEDDIPVYRGNIEDWWHYGVSSTSNETAINKENHDYLPAAEYYATMASAFANTHYPYEDIFNAYRHMILYDEHTWGSDKPHADDQWIWKRNNAIAGKILADQVMARSLEAIQMQIPALNKTIVVHNALSWELTDVVEVETLQLPDHFDIIDNESGSPVAYQKSDENHIVFVASDVPGLGYKTYEVRERADDPVFTTSLRATADTIENDFYKVTLDATGAIASIIDKQNGNREMVDSAAPYLMNEFVYFTTKTMSHDVYTTHTINQSQLSTDIGEVMGTITADGTTVGVESMKRNIILYDEIPRIDIVNEVMKSDAPSFTTQDEEAFFVFPLNMPDFMLRHEMPTGDFRPYVHEDIENPNNEQFYSSSTAYYTVNRWINASNQEDYGITLSLLSNPIVQYGERRSALGPWDYNMENPWVYNFVFNNKWHTNFQKTQPGPVTFKYSLASHSGEDWKAGRADKFGMERSTGLQSSVISEAQTGGNLNANKGQFISIDQDHVVLTAAKLAEANGEGLILRFNETLGLDTTVTLDLGMFSPTFVMETDLVENNRSSLELTGSKVTFSIKGHGWKTLRVHMGERPSHITNISAITDSKGTYITWDSLEHEGIAYYEVFRGTEKNFLPGSGSYLTSTSANHYFDMQVNSEINGQYYYKLRAVNPGLKGPYSTSAQAMEGEIEDTTPPSVPDLIHAEVQNSSRVSLAWQPSTDNLHLKGYKIYRDGDEIRELSSFYNSFLDTEAKGGQTHSYGIKAYDIAGNMSVIGQELTVTMPETVIIDGNVAPLAQATASSEFNQDYSASKVNDDIIGVHAVGEWASAGELNPWIQLDWPGIKTVNKVVLYDRENLHDNVNSGILHFSDGSTVNVENIAKDGAAKEVEFESKAISWFRFETTGGEGSHVGLSEIQVYEAPNVAKQAKISASSQFSGDYAAEKVTDGIIGVHDSGEWASSGELNPSIELTWDAEVTINRIRIYDRMNLQDNANSGVLHFSDGSSIEVVNIPADGSVKEILFDSKTVSSVLFEVSGGTGFHVGLSEIEIY